MWAFLPNLFAILTIFLVDEIAAFAHTPSDFVGHLGVDFVVARILDQMGIEQNLGKRWTGEEVQ